ncbi:MAG: hypothetical protein ACXWID_13135 [Pyrinomonadaceae bacterium]
MMKLQGDTFHREDKIRKNILVLASITLVLLALNNVAGQARQSQRPAATRSLVKKFWARYATVDIESKPLNDELIDLLIKSLTHEELVDKIVSLKTRRRTKVTSEMVEGLSKKSENELEQIISEFPAGEPKIELASAFKFWRDTEAASDIKRSARWNPSQATQVGLLQDAKIVDVILSYNRRLGGQWLGDLKSLEVLGFSGHLALLDRAQLAYLLRSRSKYGNQSNR